MANILMVEESRSDAMLLRTVHMMEHVLKRGKGMPDTWIAIGLVLIAVLVFVVRPIAQASRIEGHLESIENRLLEINARLQHVESRQHNLGDRVAGVEVLIPGENAERLRRLAKRKKVPPEYVAWASVDKTLQHAEPPESADPFPEIDE